MRSFYHEVCRIHAPIYASMFDRFHHHFSDLWQSVRHLSHCALCHCPCQNGLCSFCHHHYFEKQVIRCHCCGHILPALPYSEANPLCTECVHTKHAFDATIVATDYAPPWDQLVHLLKFQYKLAIAPLMGELIYQAILKQPQPSTFYPDIMMAVPLGRIRLIERGFNQSHEIAKTLAKRMNIALATELIYRNRETQKQSTISFEARKNNVMNAFSLAELPASFFEGKHIGLVDDILTTGHTLEEIARTLKKVGVKRITNFVFARTAHKLLQEN